MIELRQLTKSYRTKAGRHFVLKDVDLTIPSGRNVGIVGPNGAGKSTLLRLIGRTEYPDCGEVVTQSKISWPVGLSGGFQGSLSGRDNIKFVCRIHGMDRAETLECIEFVREFAEIAEYFDQPVQSYSNGMRSRLAFGLSMAFDFDYYLIDEVMAVGDKHFVDKSKAVFEQRTQGASLIVVSHNMQQLKSQCDMGIFVAGGQLSVYDNVADAIARYNQL